MPVNFVYMLSGVFNEREQGQSRLIRFAEHVDENVNFSAHIAANSPEDIL
jgi:hypothetical protein